MRTYYILGIETSCDDTSVAIIKGSSNRQDQASVLAHESFSPHAMLDYFGGVVPELASREHIKKIVPTLKKCLLKANISLEQIDAIGVTSYPGLIGPLLTGINIAKSISLIHKTPILGVNHLFAHLEAIFLTHEISYPYLGLLVSGGHSLFAIVQSPHELEILGSTIDDAAGEAFDKGGKLLGLGYPAGALIDRLAKQGDPHRFDFPIGLKSSKDCRLSFSGVKTSLSHFISRNKNLDYSPNSTDLKDLCASYQEAIISALALKTRYALQACGRPLQLVVGGGVACNSRLREVLKKQFPHTYFVKPAFCTDNGAMVANYTYRNLDRCLPFPQCLEIDAKGRFIDKSSQPLAHA